MRKIFARSLVLFVIVTAAFLTAAANAQDLVVATMAGSVQGAPRANGGVQFLGIPYAQPPIGDLRWKPPIPVKAWKGVRDATAFGAPCAQQSLGDWNKDDAAKGKEDCLFVNVMVPEWPVKKPLPVMVWIHGGGNAGGTASSELYRDGKLVNHGVILVTLNYRLGVFGFLAHPELTAESPRHSSGDYGLMDQLLALEWVHRNITAFGGDPANVTLFGQSAGAWDANMLMTAPAKGLFQKVILESGNAVTVPVATLAEEEQAGEKFAAMMNAPSGAGALSYLRGLSTDEILQALSKPDSAHETLGGLDIDGGIIFEQPVKVFHSGRQYPLPMIIGNNAQELSFAGDAESQRTQLSKMAEPYASQALKIYGYAGNGSGTNDPLYGSADVQWATDFVHRCSATVEAQWQTKVQKKVYRYQFEHAIPGQEAKGAMHSGELPYVFGYYPKTGNISGQFNATDDHISDVIETYWTNFAKTGNPNGDNGVPWPEFGKRGATLHFHQDGSAEATQKPPREAECGLYRKILAKKLKK
ncbi:carboxylesterase/lipase family protein [Silvibacterium acidisoli]|uniref:carboxylesterase/lipase family protein n=1 Tax=Acidobacteriaceae bacterium ZG23-2 TaxID=2883246 RepID=UPI00406C238F